MTVSRKRLGIVMDPIATIKPEKDTSFAMLLEAERRGYEVLYFEQRDLWLDNGVAHGRGRSLHVVDRASDFFELGERQSLQLGSLDVVLMRKDPPFDMEYIYTTYILERASTAGTLVVNKPQALRDMNEKMFTAWFPDLCPPTLVTRSKQTIKAFIAEQGKAIVKPLDGMGGRSIFAVNDGDPNTNVILETLTDNEQRFAMAQGYVPEIVDGDKRVIVIDGEPLDFLLARIPGDDDPRGNLVMGARGEGRPLGDNERAIATRVGERLKKAGVLFAGLDVIGSALTEINVTSPTGIREIDRQFGTNSAGRLFDAIERHISNA
ncbi:MAG: glutathione synthase [Pseudomonadota bacterium]